jgi:HK97 family phage portal protein
MKLPKWLSRKSSSLDLFSQIWGGRQSKAGPTITVDKALEVTTVLACVRSIANGVSQVPCQMFERTEGGGKRAADHPVAELLKFSPNPGMTAFDFWRTVVFHVALTGNAYVWIGRVGRKREVRVLEIIEPRRVQVDRKTSGLESTITYKVSADDGSQIVLPADQIWHIKGPSWNGWIGLDAIRYAREAIGLAIAMEESHADYHRNGARASGLLAVKEPMGDDKFTFLSAWLDRHAPDGDRAGKPMIMDRSATYTPFGMTGVDAQHLETRKHQIEEICRSFGVLPLMVGFSDKTATYASAEQMFIAHVTHTMTPWYAMLEQSAALALLTEDERKTNYFKFNANAMMRGAAKDRAEFYAKALGAGGHGTAYMVPDEVRALEDLDPIEGGDKLPVGATPAANPKTTETPNV